jgi:uncharacterized protein YihD (DUF1040 family)
MERRVELLRNPKRIERILKKLGKLWEECSDLRLGQALENFARAKGIDLFYLEDEDLERGLDLLLEEISKYK